MSPASNCSKRATPADPLVSTSIPSVLQVLVTPSHVDYVELKPIPNRRTEWTLEEGKTEWDEQILVP